jgi:hypothetical protein
LQTGGHTLKDSTLKALNLTKDEGKYAIEALKHDNGLGPNFHRTKIWSDGNVYDSQTGMHLGNLYDYLPQENIQCLRCCRNCTLTTIR